jgi:putative membrane protein
MKQLLQVALLFTVSTLGATPAWAEEARAGTMPGWTWPPYIILPLLLVGILYALGTVRMWRRRQRARRQSARNYLPAIYFSAGWLSLLLALDSPMHELSEQLFWVHMTQHEVLMLVSAPLLVLGRPLLPFLWVMPAPIRLGMAAFSRSTIFRFLWGKLSAPLSAWFIFAAALWIWHAPKLFAATLDSEWIHATQHISFLAASLLFWWALLDGRGGRLGYGGALLYVFTMALHSSILGALLTFAPTVWYTPYLATAPAWHLSALEDQQLGGLIMWVPAGALLLIFTLVLMAKWLQESDRRWEYTRTAALLRAAPKATTMGVRNED